MPRIPDRGQRNVAMTAPAGRASTMFIAGACATACSLTFLSLLSPAFFELLRVCALHRKLTQDLDFRLQRWHGDRIGWQAGVLAVDIDQRIDLAVNADGRDASNEYRVRSVVELGFLGADDVRLRVGQDRDA